MPRARRWSTLPSVALAASCLLVLPGVTPAVQNQPPQNQAAQNQPAQNPPAQNPPAQNPPAQNPPAQPAPPQNPPAPNGAAPTPPAPEPVPLNKPPEGFVSLFNGKDLSGWKVPVDDGGHWKVIDGIIDYDGQSQAKGDKNLWTDLTFGDFILRVDWRIKETPYTNPNVPYILPDGTHARDVTGKEMKLSLPDSDSGVILRGDVRNQINIWCWPIGSGEMYGYRMDPKMPPEVRAAVTPRTQADKPVGEWNTYEITVRGNHVTVVLNGKPVIDAPNLPGLAPNGPIGLQHHGAMQDGKWTSPPALMQFRNLYLKQLDNQ